MFKRWAIRSGFILPILVCLVEWGWSVNYSGATGYSDGGHFIMGGTDSGVVYISGGLDYEAPNGWGLPVYPNDEPRFWPREETGAVFTFLAFRLQHQHPDRTENSYRLEIPYWFLIVVFSFILFFVWRTTGRKKPGRGFPVEIGADRRRGQ